MVYVCVKMFVKMLIMLHNYRKKCGFESQPCHLLGV